MLKFTDQELKWIKSELQKILKVWNEGSKEELKEFISMQSGEILDTALLFSNFNFKLFKEVNDSEYFNRKIVDFCWDGCGLWVWRESNFTTADEVAEFIGDDPIHCNLYEKILDYYIECDKDLED